MAHFSEKTKHLLKQADWFEGREIDPTPYVEALKDAGYTVFPSVVEFLRQFGGLRLSYQYTPPYFGTSEVHFDTTDITATFTSNVEDNAALIGTPLCLIGEADDYLTPIMMDALGRVYCRDEDRIYFIGATGEEGIESYLGDDHSRVVEVWRYSEG